MSAATEDDLRSFHAFIGRQLENGGADLTPEQVLTLWRERLEKIESRTLKPGGLGRLMTCSPNFRMNS